LLLVIEESDRARVMGFDLDERIVLKESADRLEDVVVTALLYRESLEALGLPQGELRPAEGPAGAPLPTARQVLVADLDAQTWEPGALGARARAFRVDSKGCMSWKYVRSVDVPLPGYAIPIEPESILMVSGSGHSPTGHLVGADGTVEAVDLGTPMATRSENWHISPEGQIWVVDGTELWSGTLAEGFVRTATVPEVKTRLRGLDGSRGGAPFELVLHGFDEIYRFDGESWVSAYRVGSRPRSRQVSSIAWVGESEALASFDDTFEIVHLTADGEERLIPVSPESVVRDIQFVPGYGIVVGTFDGVVARFIQGVLEPLSPGPTAEIRIASFFGYRDSLIAASEDGLLQEYSPDLGWCPSAQAISGAPHSIVVSGDAIFVVRWISDADPVTVDILKGDG
jgi:hypothetical protein